MEVVFRWRLSSFDTFVHYDLIPIASVSNLSKIHPVVAEILNITNVYGGTSGWVGNYPENNATFVAHLAS